MSDTLIIQLDGDKRSYQPGEKVTGTFRWEIDGVPESVEVRLVWSTHGKGTRNFQVVETVTLRSSMNRDQQKFQLTAPDSPYSCSGRLVSIAWGVEAVIEPGSLSAREDIVISPWGTEVDFYRAGEVSEAT